ncbi:hypothetical protein ACFWYW_39525 [Nonomuraea sp. NPDC059023]|uniref:hypothetical protein n=1 Tax=unclassified Nonomuraea TaxID=2593643 RepID=UPI0036C2CCB9
MAYERGQDVADLACVAWGVGCQALEGVDAAEPYVLLVRAELLDSLGEAVTWPSRAILVVSRAVSTVL